MWGILTPQAQISYMQGGCGDADAAMLCPYEKARSRRNQRYKNDDALPAEMGVAAERARRLQERRSLSKLIQWAAVELPLRGPLQALRRSRACHRDGAGLA